MNTLTGHMLVQNVIRYDYPFIEAFKSIEPACDKFIFCDGFSDDGTYEVLLDLQKEFPDKVEIFRDEWKTPDWNVFAEVINKCIERCKTEWHIQISADEVYHENNIGAFKDAINNPNYDWYSIPQIHFWSNCFDQYIIPGKYFGGIKNIKMARVNTYPGFCSRKDGYTLGIKEGFYMPHLRGHHLGKKIQIYHYSYTRRPAMHKKKCQHLLKTWFGFDDRRFSGDKPVVYEEMIPFAGNCLYFGAAHPRIIKDWINRHIREDKKVNDNMTIGNKDV